MQSSVIISMKSDWHYALYTFSLSEHCQQIGFSMFNFFPHIVNHGFWNDHGYYLQANNISIHMPCAKDTSLLFFNSTSHIQEDTPFGVTGLRLQCLQGFTFWPSSLIWRPYKLVHVNLHINKLIIKNKNINLSLTQLCHSSTCYQH